jgi:phosphoribosyl-AMP cyclohydrolase
MSAVPPPARPPAIEPPGPGTYPAWLDAVRWNADGLVPAITQDAVTLQVLTLAWMNRHALELTVRTREAHYWSRSRVRLWRKGESSGHVQRVRDVRLDCDGDTLLVLVEQVGGIACHTGHARCFYSQLQDGAWHDVEPVVRTPNEIYGRG